MMMLMTGSLMVAFGLLAVFAVVNVTVLVLRRRAAAGLGEDSDWVAFSDGPMAEAGAEVERDQPLLIMEAMKMEHVITAPVGGVVLQVAVSSGDTVYEGYHLLWLIAALSLLFWRRGGGVPLGVSS